MKENWKSTRTIDSKYKRWTNQIKSTMYKCLDRITIKNRITNKTIRAISKRRKDLSKQVTKLKKMGINKGVVVTYLLEVIKDLKLQTTINIHKERIEKMKKQMEKAISKSQITNEIWNIRKRNRNKNDQ